MRLIFCTQINIKVSCKLISTFLDNKVSYKVILSLLMGMIKHFQSAQSNKLAKYLQYLKKGVRERQIFCMKINIKVSTNGIIIFDRIDQTYQKYAK